jgi:hypothetical protein
MHLAELLATAGNLGYERPEPAAAPRPAPSGALAKAATVLADGSPAEPEPDVPGQHHGARQHGGDPGRS